MLVRQFMASFMASGVASSPAQRGPAAADLAGALVRGELNPQEERDAQLVLTALLDDPSPLVRGALALKQGEGRFKGVAVLAADTSTPALRALQAQGVVGVAFNCALHGLAYYQDIDPLLSRLAELGLWAQFQVEGDQLAALLPRLERSGVRTLIDHCGRPTLADGPDAPGVLALLRLADSGLGVIKLSGFAKFSQQGYPFADAQAHVMRLWQAFGPERCLWASDWPYLRAGYRLDYGTLLKLAEQWFTPDQCQHMMWDTPKKLFNW